MRGRHPAQQAYLDAQGEVERLGRVVDEAARPLNAQVEAGEISEDTWAQARDDLDEQLGLLAATRRRDEARRALIDWGLAQVRTLWPTYGRLFPGHSLATLEALFARPEAQRRLVSIILKLQDWA
ncbi:hypothetical protein D3875_02515 [Deinococcus cavernae]|uniref:Uncharacterized protein n=1 Tax=Deinococcus cavernae TaxID=2320857 RepID=A0A418VFR9_9DEIO|nr:hypothetical protein [Deinococcus cavernae]RJF74886.1 hypothetical protein D3875_02515 [Deinococcus cavernae]